jgi:hypothetical protein
MQIGVTTRGASVSSQDPIPTPGTSPTEPLATGRDGVALASRDRFRAAAMPPSRGASQEDQLSSLIQMRANRERAQEALPGAGDAPDDETSGAGAFATPEASSEAAKTSGEDPAPAETPDDELGARQAKAVESALQEWRAGVHETTGPNRGPRIDQYVRNAKMPLGLEWCGMFDAFNLSQVGFGQPWALASYRKARDFFLYRDFVSNTGSAANQKLDTLREKQRDEGSERQYFLLEGSNSPTVKLAHDYSTRYQHYDPAANTFDAQHLPIRPGDTVLFSHSHIGMVESYDPASGQLNTVEGNATGLGVDGKQHTDAVVRKSYDLNDPQVRKLFDGFGRPALGDLT